MSAKPIGIFDSGAGGLSIWKEISLLMPGESTEYISDAKYAPYGPKGKEAIIKRSIINTEKLLDMGAKIIVVACNTATTSAISSLRKTYKVPFIGIEPAIKPAALATNTNKIGVLATKGTLSSALFYKTSKKYTQNKTMLEIEGKGIVELIESGKLHSQEMRKLLMESLKPVLDSPIDCLVLGCTHYHFLIPILRELLPKDIRIIDSGLAVARHTQFILKKKALQNNSNEKGIHNFYTNGSVETMANLMGWKPTSINKTY